MSREVLHKDLQVSVKQCIQTVTIQRKSNTTKTGKLSQKNQTQTEWQYNTGLRGTITRNDFSWFITTNRPFHHKIILFLAAVVYFGSAHKQLWALRAQMKNKGCRKSTVINYYSLFFPSHIWIFLLWCPENSEGELWFMQTHSTVLHLCSPMSRLSSPNEMLAERSVFWYTGSCLISLWFCPVSLLIWKFSVLKHISVKSCKWKNHFNNSSWSPLKLKAMISQ